MRTARRFFIIVLALAAASATACTNPLGPKPSGDTVTSSSI